MGDDDKITFEREREIFFAALEKVTEGSRALYLQETCGDEAAMVVRGDLERVAYGTFTRISTGLWSLTSRIVGRVFGLPATAPVPVMMQSWSKAASGNLLSEPLF